MLNYQINTNTNYKPIMTREELERFEMECCRYCEQLYANEKEYVFGHTDTNYSKGYKSDNWEGEIC